MDVTFIMVPVIVKSYMICIRRPRICNVCLLIPQEYSIIQVSVLWELGAVITFGWQGFHGIMLECSISTPQQPSHTVPIVSVEVIPYLSQVFLDFRQRIHLIGLYITRICTYMFHNFCIRFMEVSESIGIQVFLSSTCITGSQYYIIIFDIPQQIQFIVLNP